VAAGKAIAALVAVLAAGLLAPSPAAAAWVVHAETEAQVYELRAWRRTFADEETVARQRIYQRLSLFGREEIGGHGLDVDLHLRVGTDLGWRTGEARALGLSPHTAEVLTGTVRWRDAGGRFDLTAGRILQLDAFDFRYVDGAEAGYRVGALRVAGYGGWLVGAGSFLGSPTFEPDGVRIGRTDVDEDALPHLVAPQQRPSLLVGGNVAYARLVGPTAFAGYHRAFRGGSVDMERLSAALGYRHRRFDALFPGEYDLFMARPSSLQAKGGWYADPLTYLGAEVLHVRPTFHADSIWNVFATGPIDEGALHARRHLGDRWTASARARLRRYSDPSAATEVFAQGGDLGLAWREGRRRRVQGRVWALTGFGGTDVRGLLSAESAFGERFTGLGHLAGGFVHDPLLPDLRSPVLGARVGLRYRFDPRATFTVFVEESMSRHLRHDLRAYALLDLGLHLR
jgi:hypothetical protein